MSLAERLRRWNIGAGNFFFRYRNAVFPAAFAVAIAVMRPRVIGSPSLDRWLALSGATLALAGEAVRLLTIGHEYIERGGKEGKVYASRLVRRGMYGVTRNPMYLGNGLIAIGMSMATGSPAAYLVVIPFFLLAYQAIVSAEEAYLRERFGREYGDYCAEVNRFFPSFRGMAGAFEGVRYHWKRAVRQDLSTMTGLALGLVLLPVWRAFFLDGWAAVRAMAPGKAAASAGILIAYAALHQLKKRQWLS